MQVVVTRRRTNERKSIERCAMAERSLTDRAMFVKSRSVEATRMLEDLHSTLCLLQHPAMA